MAFIWGSDEYQSVDITLFPRIYTKCKELDIKNGDILTPGTVISTGFRSSAVLYIGKSLIEVRALTRLTIEEIVEQNQII